MKKIWAAALAALPLMMAGTADAATYVRDGVIDLSAYASGTRYANLNAARGDISFVRTPDLVTGDIITGTIKFAGDASITIFDNADNEYVSFWVANDAKDISNVESTFKFLGLSGDFSAKNDFFSYNGGCCASSSASGALTNSSFSFSGFEYSMKFNGSVPSSKGSFDAFTFFTSAASYTVPATAAVPEPATWALMILGFGVVGASLRRRRPDRRIAVAG